MAKLTRRGVIAVTAAAGAVRVLPTLANKPQARRVLALVYDKSLGMTRAIDQAGFLRAQRATAVTFRWSEGAL